MTVSNRRPPTCKDGALPTELIAHKPILTSIGNWDVATYILQPVDWLLAFWISYVNTSARPISAWAPPRHPVKVSIASYIN